MVGKTEQDGWLLGERLRSAGFGQRTPAAPAEDTESQGLQLTAPPLAAVQRVVIDPKQPGFIKDYVRTPYTFLSEASFNALRERQEKNFQRLMANNKWSKVALPMIPASKKVDVQYAKNTATRLKLKNPLLNGQKMEGQLIEAANLALSVLTDVALSMRLLQLLELEIHEALAAIVTGQNALLPPSALADIVVPGGKPGDIALSLKEGKPLTDTQMGYLKTLASLVVLQDRETKQGFSRSAPTPPVLLSRDDWMLRVLSLPRLPINMSLEFYESLRDFGSHHMLAYRLQWSILMLHAEIFPDAWTGKGSFLGLLRALGSVPVNQGFDWLAVEKKVNEMPPEQAFSVNTKAILREASEWQAQQKQGEMDKLPVSLWWLLFNTAEQNLTSARFLSQLVEDAGVDVLETMDATLVAAFTEKSN